MKTGVLAFVAFLLIGLRSVYCAELSVGIYGSYDYNNKNFSVFWKPIGTYTNYIVTLYRNTPTTTTCPQTLVETQINSITVSSSVGNATFTNIDINNRYIVKIQGINGGTQTQIYNKEFYIWVVSKSYSVEWCPSSGHSNTIEYNTPVPSFSFGSSKDIATWTSSKLDKSFDHYTVNNMMLVNVFTNPTTNQVSYSEPSAQVITFTILPDAPKWDGVKE